MYIYTLSSLLFPRIQTVFVNLCETLFLLGQQLYTLCLISCNNALTLRDAWGQKQTSENLLFQPLQNIVAENDGH